MGGLCVGFCLDTFRKKSLVRCSLHDLKMYQVQKVKALISI